MQDIEEDETIQVEQVVDVKIIGNFFFNFSIICCPSSRFVKICNL